LKKAEKQKLFTNFCNTLPPTEGFSNFQERTSFLPFFRHVFSKQLSLQLKLICLVLLNKTGA